MWAGPVLMSPHTELYRLVLVAAGTKEGNQLPDEET